MSNVGSVTKYFATANEGFATTLASTILSGATTMPLTTASGLTNGSVFVGIIEPGLAKQQVFTGTVDTVGVQLTGVVWTRGSNADHSAGVAIVDYVTGTNQNMLSTGILVNHTQSGSHKTLTDANGNEWLRLSTTASAVNDITVANAATGNSPVISATGDDSNIDLNINPKGSGIVKINGSAPKLFFQNATANFIESGCIWTADAAGSTLLASMTSGVVWIGGKRLTVAAVTSRAFTASKDTYIDFQDHSDGTATITYTTATNNAASAALANSGTTATTVRNGIIITGASSIASAASINQGSTAATGPTVSSNILTVCDSLGNLIYPTAPNPGLIGYRQITSTFNTNTSASFVTVTGLDNCIVNVPQGRKVRVKGYSGQVGQGGTTVLYLAIFESSTQLQQALYNSSATVSNAPLAPEVYLTPSAGVHTYTVKVQASAGSGTGVTGSSTAPAFISVELV